MTARLSDRLRNWAEVVVPDQDGTQTILREAADALDEALEMLPIPELSMSPVWDADMRAILERKRESSRTEDADA